VAGDPVPFLTASYSGFVNGDTPDSLDTPLSLSASDSNMAGTYDIVASGASAANYAITYVNGTLTVTPGAATSLVFTGLSSTVTAGQPTDVTVTAFDAYGNTATGYAGTVTFTSSDTSAQLPDPYTFTADDQGSHTFTGGLTMFMTGDQTLTASDLANGLSLTVTLTVNP
jgi:hypothetical protein